jgi:hypothetical protein
MVEYKYVKSVVNLDRLVLEIEENQDITKVCKYGSSDCCRFREQGIQ